MRRIAPLALVLTVAAIGVVVLTNRTDRYTVTAEFTDVRGLVSGAQVRLAGVPVGEVGRIWLGADGWPRLQLSIDRDVSMRATGDAAVRMASLSGEFNDYVSIVQGDGAPLAPGAVIPRSRTTSPVEVDEALGTFDPGTRAALRQILAGMRASLAGQGPALAATLRYSQTALAQLAGLAGDVGDDGTALSLGLHSARVLASTLASHSTQLGDAVDASAQLLRTVASHAGSLAAGLAGMPAALDATSATLAHAQALIAPAGRLLGAAAPAVAQLPATAGELRSALQTADPTLSRAASVASIAPRAAHAMSPVLREAGPLLAVMIPVLQRLGPMLDQLRVRFPDAFSFFANWADFTANYDANGHAARVGIVLPPAPTNTLSANSNGPGQLAPPYLRTPGSLEGQPWTNYAKSFVFGGKR
jgi:phospholipid/cholesterol/gamma-HCH transport system substrate-binding protein